MPYFMKTKLAIGDGGITSLKKKIYSCIYKRRNRSDEKTLKVRLIFTLTVTRFNNHHKTTDMYLTRSASSTFKMAEALAHEISFDTTL